jgi:hypothetical protein
MLLDYRVQLKSPVLVHCFSDNAPTVVVFFGCEREDLIFLGKDNIIQVCLTDQKATSTRVFEMLAFVNEAESKTMSIRVVQ